MARDLCFYSRRTNAELEAMYKARTGNDMPKTKKKTMRRHMSNELRKVDRYPWLYGTCFRFLDLPAEMRNLIYRELLPVPPRTFGEMTARPRERCQPAILRVCKQTSSETKGILYGNSEGEIRIETFIGYGTVSDRITMIFGSLCEIAYGSRLGDNRREWESFLLNFELINVRIDLKHWCRMRLAMAPFDALHVTNQELLGLVSFLSRSAALKTLRVIVGEPMKRSQDVDFVSMLRPLTRIGPKVGIELPNVPQEIKDQILQEKETYADPKHFFADFQEMHDTLKKLEAFRVSVDPMGTLLSVKDQRASMEAALNVTGFIDDQVEKQLRDATAKAKAFLGGGVFDKVSRLARQKTKEMKQETAQKIEELEGLHQKFVEAEKAARDTSVTTTARERASR